MMTTRRMSLSLLLVSLCAFPFARPLAAQEKQPAPAADSSGQTDQSGQAGPTVDNGDIILKKKKDEPPPPPVAPAERKVTNPNNDVYSLRVDVPIVNLDVSVILDKTHQFVPGLKPSNFLVLEDGAEQEIQTIRMTQAPITAVMLLEFAANSYYFIHDMQNAAIGFYSQLRQDDYVAVITYDNRTHILTDFTNDKGRVAQSIQTLTIPGMSDTNMFDALYETLDRTTRIDGRKYIILIGTGRDTFSKLTLDEMLAKVKATPNVTIFCIATGGFVNEMSTGNGMNASMRNMNYLQAQNQLKTFAQMTGGQYYAPIFQGELPDIFGRINESIRNQYILTYRPTNGKNDGSYRKIKVLLVDNEGKPLKMQDEKGKPVKYSVIARDGYKAKLPVE